MPKRPWTFSKEARRCSRERTAAYFDHLEKQGSAHPSGIKDLAYMVTKATVHPDHLLIEWRVDSAAEADGDPTGIRTRVTAVKGRCLRPLDHGAWSGWRDLNPRPLAPKASALAKLRYIPEIRYKCYYN